ncbi:hypothetical protein Taro_003187 [Colocasia esculenta]|uniref:CCHC-type domain-containing protein n=1 Tax=Colocasia esculenta TaxID=4460 RepID=A0A843TER0_COLES|nr:hypothetical protein [Colocasia esculenta]
MPQALKFEMADRRDWGGGGNDPEESTQHMIERIWESLTDIRARMDQRVPVPPVAVPPGDGEAVPVAPVPPGVEVPFLAPLPPPPLLLVEEPVMQVEKFLRLQPPTYSGGPNPDTTEHWIHEIERVFATMRCPATDKVVLATYQLRGFALEWWRLKMQTTFAGRTEEAITWSKFLDVFNDTFFPIQVQQVKREQFRTLQQGNSSVLEYQMRFMALSRYAPYVVSDNNMMVEYFIRGLRVELQDAIVPLMCKTVEEVAQRAATLERSIRTRQAGDSGSGKGRGWGGRQQFQQGRGRPEVEESQQSTARQPITPPGYRCYNCNQPGHLIRNCPYPREYGYGRGVQQQQPQQFQQPQSGEMLSKTCIKNKVQMMKIYMKSKYLSTAGKVPVDSYTQARRPIFSTDEPVDSTPATCRQEEVPRTTNLLSACACRQNPVACRQQLPSRGLESSAFLRLSTGAPSAIDRRRKSSNTESLQVAIDGVSTYHDSPYVNTYI